MSSEIFRFVIVRPPHRSSATTPRSDVILHEHGSELFERLREARGAGDRVTMRALASEFMASASFLSAATRLDPSLKNLLARVRALDDLRFAESFNEAVRAAFGASPREVLQGTPFKDTSRRVSESIVASAIDGQVKPATSSFLLDIAAVLQLLEAAAANHHLAKPRRSDLAITLPAGILPMPSATADLRGQRKKDLARAKSARAQRGARSLKLTQELDAHHAAIAEIMSAFERASHAEPLHTDSTSAPARIGAGFLLRRSDVDQLSPGSIATLKDLNVYHQELDVAKAITAIDRSAFRLSDQLYRSTTAAGRVVKVGNRLVPESAMVDEVFEASDQPTRYPGACPPPLVEDDAAVHTPFPLSDQHHVRVLGVADLLKVEQTLKRYELGEIAHIENVLRSEQRAREHRIKTTVEESLTTETEETEQNEKDLSSSDRFELQTETQNTITETTSLTAGVTVSASYGPVDTSTNLNRTSSDSSTESQRAASNFARDTISRAVSKIEKRKLERRFRRTLVETEETNRHQFDNRTPDDITGIYRFVDKIYSAQIVNYGKRLILEFMVPEPAAFLRHVLGHRPMGAVTLANPEAPGYCTNGGKTFTPLQAADIDRYNYIYWASKYGVTDIEPPPPYTLVVSSSLTSSLKEMESAGGDDDEIIDGDNKSYFNTKSVSIDIPDGYTPVTADVVIDAMLDVQPQPGTPTAIHVLIDNKLLQTGGTNRVTLTPGTWKNVAIAANTFNKALYAVVMNLFCQLSVEKEQQWKLKTFNSIMSAYEDKKSRYENAVATAAIQASFQAMQGSNPFLNRETEKTELKKNCIALLTGQRFESFDGIIGRVGPYGYPEVDFDEAAEEGRVISFFEQSFEWTNMTYLFYPYFWGRKSDWLVTSQLTDDDPLFTRFLQAGAARVNVPVRVGFEHAVVSYLSTNVLWSSEGSVLAPDPDTSDDPPELSLVDELRSQLSDSYVSGLGSLAVTHGQTVATGDGTAFTLHDENRRLNVAGSIYVIKKIDVAAQTVELQEAYAGPTNGAVGYGLGPKLVGEPWEVKLPTTLVKLGDMPIV